MFNPFNRIQDSFNKGVFQSMPRKDQDAMLQHMYDQGYTASEVGKFFGLQSIAGRINAHRGRGPGLATA